MESGSRKQLLKRIAALASDNKDLKEKQRMLTEENRRLANEVYQYKEWREKAKTEQLGAKKQNVHLTRFDTVTILYVNIQGFSDLVTAADTSEYMDELDNFVLRFNEIVEKYQLVKLHGIGDCFICAGGIPDKNITNPITVTMAALEMLNIVETDLKKNDNQPVWGLNIGIHTGSVSALIGGRTQSNYDLKGDTVNVASRIGSVGRENTVVISATTYEFVKELFDCRYTSALPVKYRNKLDIFSVSGIKTEFAADDQTRLPNDTFRIRWMLIQFSDLQEYILDKMEKGLPDYLFYHNVKHTVDVVTESELIGWAEGLDDYRLLLLKTAALFHDLGHTVSYVDHEERSADLAREILPKYKYTPEEIEEICRIIMATKLPPNPADLLEAIICDSDLDYLGRTDFLPVSNALYAELQSQNKSLTINDWNKQQLKFISMHQYFTKTGRKLREVKKQEQIKRIMQLMEN